MYLTQILVIGTSENIDHGSTDLHLFQFAWKSKDV